MIRRGVRGDEATVRGLRFSAMRDSPGAFGSTMERERARTVEDWQSWIDGGVTFLAENDDGVAVGLVVGRESAEGGFAELLSMWVAPESRSTGVADDLVRSVREWAVGQGVEDLRLFVTAGNDRARRLYERHGFRLTGVEVRRERDGALEQEMRTVLEPGDVA